MFAALIAGGHRATVAAGVPGILRSDSSSAMDRRIVVDRLLPAHNRGREDYGFLNAVGAVWPYGIDPSPGHFAASTGTDAASGFLIDRCHVLTNLHAAYSGDLIAGAAIGAPVAFGVGQTSAEKDRGALQGLRFLLPGVVVAHGDAVVLDNHVYNPTGDWALIRLADNVHRDITPLTVTGVEVAQLPPDLEVFSAGFPTDHRSGRPDGLRLKDLWASAGRVVGIDVMDGGALIETTLQITPGGSGGPVYTNTGRGPEVIGLVQSYRGNGIDTSRGAPNVQILITPHILAAIERARERSPCP